VNRDHLGLAWLCAYIGIFIDVWNCRLDEEDGSTAPFSAHAAEMADETAAELDACIEVMTQ
jgi:hypothetical protein